LRRAVLFDFDGTLIDTWRLYLESFRRSLEPHFQRLLSDREILDYRPVAERRLLQGIVEPPRFSDYFAAFLGHYRSLHATHCDGLYRGTRDMVDGLRRAGYRLGIVTGKSREAWDLTFRHSQLPPFDVVVTDDDVQDPKPDPAGLIAALRAIEVNPSHAVYIGDSLLDCRAAHAAQMSFGAALWSKSGPEAEEFRKSVRALGDARYFPDPPSVIEGLAHWDGERTGLR